MGQILAAVHMAFFHYLFADWPNHLLMVLEHFSSLLRENEIGKQVFKSYWESEALIQRLFPPNRESETFDPYQHLTLVLEMLALKWRI
ncbi:MAG: hypothetical protein ACXWPG_07480 [Ktedonobacteraceae bacterium]